MSPVLLPLPLGLGLHQASQVPCAGMFDRRPANALLIPSVAAVGLPRPIELGHSSALQPWPGTRHGSGSRNQQEVLSDRAFRLLPLPDSPAHNLFLHFPTICRAPDCSCLVYSCHGEPNRCIPGITHVLGQLSRQSSPHTSGSLRRRHNSGRMHPTDATVMAGQSGQNTIA